MRYHYMSGFPGFMIITDSARSVKSEKMTARHGEYG